MLSRLDFYDLEEDMREIKIYELGELSSMADNFITNINSINNNKDINLRIQGIKKAEEKAREMIQLIVTKINPDLNWMISLDNKQNDSYKKLTDCLGFILDSMEKQKETLKNNLSNKEFMESNRITNQVTLDFYSSSLSNLINSLVYNPIKEACFKFLFLEKTDESIKRYEENQIVITGDDGKGIIIKKDKTLFWFLVFSYLFRSSQVIGFFSQGGSMPRTLEFKEIQRLKHEQFKQKVEMQRFLNSQKEEEPKESENKPEEKQEEVLKPENLYFPKVNGSEEKSEEEQEDSEFEDEEEIEEED
ncbi:MAG: hypothetical protein KKF48_02355 [Nanoarchaeota archaeon]|nr:hypothetical protein [Nanoarchaeota archaeon]MBU1027862.1 hypothetical protein [Nanoarchaeota archaeon]